MNSLSSQEKYVGFIHCVDQYLIGAARVTREEENTNRTCDGIGSEGLAYFSGVSGLFLKL